MYQRDRGPCWSISIKSEEAFEIASIRSYNIPNAGVGLVGLLVEALVIRHPVLCVDQTRAGMRQPRCKVDYIFVVPGGCHCGHR